MNDLNRIKIVFIGGGSLFFKDVTAEFVATKNFFPAHIVFYDPDTQRNDVMFKIAQRIIAKTGADITLAKTQDTIEAITDADFAIASVGVHGPDRQWHLADSEMAAKFGIMTTTGDTVGPSGISQGLRLIPIMVDIAKKMEIYAPNCIILNHSNPMGAVVRAVQKYTSINIIGYCHNTANNKKLFAKTLGVDADELSLQIAGVNHMVWLLDILHQGKSVYSQLREKLNALTPEELGTNRFALDVCNITDLFPIGGDRHIIEFFPHAREPIVPQNMHYGLQWRVDMIKQNKLDGELSENPHNLIEQANGKTDISIPKEGETSPEAMGEQIIVLLNGPDTTHYLTTQNNGAVPNLPSWAAVELNAVIGQGGAHAVAVGELPAVAARWTLPHIYNNELIIEAAIEKSRKKAIQALANDHMVRDFHEAVGLFDALIATHGEQLKDFAL